LLRAVEDSGRLMVSMIDSSLDMLKMERGSYESRREPIDLITVLENVIHQNGVLIQRSNIDVSIVVDGRDLPADTWIQIFSDKTNLYTMISNLVVNAIEASSDHEPIQLRVDTASPLTVSIVNRGTVPIAIREKFFEKFATFGKKKGTGLGTYSAKLIADTFGYSIDMNTSDETNQTTVTITMHGAESDAPTM
jgi:two-component system, sensor histidine kinase and response regulator